MTGDPTGTEVTGWVGDPNEQRDYWLSLELADVRIDDVVEVDALLDDRHVNRHRYPIASFEQGWLSMPVSLWAPPADAEIKNYKFLVFINGIQVRSLAVTADNNIPDPTQSPAATATHSD